MKILFNDAAYDTLPYYDIKPETMMRLQMLCDALSPIESDLTLILRGQPTQTGFSVEVGTTTVATQELRDEITRRVNNLPEQRPSNLTFKMLNH